MDTLQKYKDKPLYEVPDHFYEQFQHDVIQRVANESKRQKMRKQWISVISAAASVTIVFVLSYFIFLNKDTDEHFYVHEELALPEDSMISLDSNHLAEATKIVDSAIEEAPIFIEPLSPKAPLVAEKETIVYRAVDYYVDDFETDNFCETMYELECYYDY